MAAFHRIMPLSTTPSWAGDREDTATIAAVDKIVRGDVTTARVSRAAPAGFMDDKALQALRAARYRPRFDDAGQPVGTAGLKFRYEFVYYQEPHT